MIRAEGGMAPLRHAGVATAEQGTVLLDGPNGIATTMTPDAAEATARSLLDAAATARGQDSDHNPDKNSA